MPFKLVAPDPFNCKDLARHDRINISVPSDIAYSMICMAEHFGKVERGPNPEYMSFIRLQDCLGCTATAIAGGGRKRYAALTDYALGDTPKVQPHHIRSSGLRVKCPDEWTIPLCLTCHSKLHYQGKRRFLSACSLDHYGAYVYEIATLLYTSIYAHTKAGESSALSIKRAIQAFNDIWETHGRAL